LPTDFKGDPRSLYLLAQERQVFEFHFSEEEVGCDGQDEFVKIAVARDSSAGKTATDASPNGSGNMEQGLSAGEATEHPHYSLAVGHRKAANGTGSSTEQGALPKHISIHMFLRGTQDMVYYLGELLRRVHYEGLEPIKIDLEPPDLDPSNDQVLFALDELGEFDGEDHGLSLEYGGKTYGVPHNPSEPANPAGRTTEVLAFLNQLLALNQSSSALPATTATVISQ
jgi:hypothetical protein